MIIYWRTKEIWCPYPANDCIQERFIEYSKSKKKFEQNIFHKTSNQITMEERKQEIEKILGLKVVLQRVSTS